MRRKPPLRLVGTGDTGAIFDDLKKLQDEQTLAVPRKRLTETFARIPHDKALELYRHRVSGAAWMVLVELDRRILKARGRNPVKFSSTRLRKLGLTHRTRAYALRQLEAAGVIRVQRLGSGAVPWVTHLWWELRD